MKTTAFPRFRSFACGGDRITWSKNGFDLTATLEHDECSHTNDSDCYSPIKIKQWRNGDWFFVGVVISVSKNGVSLEEHAASLWGIECNYNRHSNKYLADVKLLNKAR
jgi:hypothetical protein